MITLDKGITVYFGYLGDFKERLLRIKNAGFTCVTTAMVCSIGSSKDAKRTGVVHIVFNTVGTILFMIVMSIIRAAGGFPGLWEGTVNSGGIANFQTIFNLLTAIVLIPFTNMLVWIACKCVKDDEEPEEDDFDSYEDYENAKEE